MLDFGKDFMKTYTWRRPVAPQMRDDERGLEQSTSSLSRLLDADGVMPGQLAVIEEQATLSIKETAVLSLEFCLLWFTANYFVAACLSYTSVASSTILTSTSSIWTLIFGALFRVEGFSYRKLIGVGASLTGIILISSIDLAGDNDDNRGKFPHKSREEMAIGDTMAFISAVMYGVYAIVMKKRIGNEDRVNMPLFFGLVGFFNVLFLWPGFVLLHVTGVETFQLPPTGKVWTIIMVRPSHTSCQHHILIQAGKLSILLRKRLLLGIRHAPHNTTGGNSRSINDHTTIPDRPNDPFGSILQSDLLGRCCCCTAIFCLHKS